MLSSLSCISFLYSFDCTFALIQFIQVNIVAKVAAKVNLFYRVTYFKSLEWLIAASVRVTTNSKTI